MTPNSAKQGGRPNAIVPKIRKRSAIPRSKPPADPGEAWEKLHALYPDAHCELDFTSPWELLVATILSAQCTDRRVNMVTPVLFRRFPGPDTLAAADPTEVENIIRSTGFFRAKTKSIMGAAAAIGERHRGTVPSTMAELVELPGVGRKTANVVLGNAFGRDEGVVVDTHVARVGRRLGLTRSEDPITIELDLMRLYARNRWTLLSHLLIWHGRRLCQARRPQCEECPLAGICPSSLV
ncbi:MAG: endonuclease III [Gemmatimonadota bacterium]